MAHDEGAAGALSSLDDVAVGRERCGARQAVAAVVALCAEEKRRCALSQLVGEMPVEHLVQHHGEVRCTVVLAAPPDVRVEANSGRHRFGWQ